MAPSSSTCCPVCSVLGPLKNKLVLHTFAGYTRCLQTTLKNVRRQHKKPKKIAFAPVVTEIDGKTFAQLEVQKHISKKSEFSPS